MKKLIVLMVSVLFSLIVPLSFAQVATPAPIQSSYSSWSPAILQISQYQQLSTDQQAALAAMWHLTVKDYSQYLWLMQNTPNGWYYADQHLDPSWVLGFNAKNEDERKKYALIAIQNERAKVEKELAFQKAFSSLQKDLYPNEFPISYQALEDSNSTSKK